MSRLSCLSTCLLLLLLCACSDSVSPSNIDGQTLASVQGARVEIGGIATRVEHFNQGQSGPYYHYESRDTTSSVYTYSFNSDVFDAAMTSLRDSGSTLLYVMNGYVDNIHIQVTFAPDGNSIRSLLIQDRRGEPYYDSGRTIHLVEGHDIPRLVDKTNEYVFEVRGQALATALQHLEYEMRKKFHSYGVSWTEDTYTMLPKYEITSDSYLRIILPR